MHASSAAPRFPRAIQVYPPWPSTPADRALVDAILDGNPRDQLARIDHALSMGAQLNDPDVYDRNAIVVAARANRQDVLSALVQRGALPPHVPDDGVDLLMEACSVGNEAQAKALIDVVGIKPAYGDRHGRSALHYAILSGSASLVRYLLSAGAGPNDAAHSLPASENDRLFGNATPLAGKEVTPLMVALALEHDAIASALLDAGADPNAGSCSPLIIAACKDRRGAFRELLSRGATLGQCRNWQHFKGLDACLYARMPATYLGQLLHMHDFNRDNGLVSSPLGTAVSLQDADAVALLIAAGAPIGAHHADSPHFSLWDQALPPRQRCSDVLDLMTARSVAVINAQDLPSIERLLDLIVDQIDAPETLASLGIFTSLLPAATEALRQIARQPHLGARQRTLQVAWILAHHLPDLQRPAAASGRHLLPHESWQFRTAAERHHQCTQLRQAAGHVISACLRELDASARPEFFIACLDGGPDQMPASVHLAHRIAIRSGAPDPVINLIRDAWVHAFGLMFDWNITPDASNQGRHMLATLTRNLLQKALDEDDIERTPLINVCLNALNAALPPETHGLGRFCHDPAAWLLRFEQSQAGRAPAHHAVDALMMELGLPRRACEGVWRLWQQLPRPTPANVQAGDTLLPHEAKRQLALQLAQQLLNDQTTDIVSPNLKLRLSNWQMQVLTPPAPPSASRKRPAGYEAAGGPPRKEPKT